MVAYRVGGVGVAVGLQTRRDPHVGAALVDDANLEGGIRDPRACEILPKVAVEFKEVEDDRLGVARPQLQPSQVGRLVEDDIDRIAVAEDRVEIVLVARHHRNDRRPRVFTPTRGRVEGHTDRWAREFLWACCTCVVDAVGISAVRATQARPE